MPMREVVQTERTRVIPHDEEVVDIPFSVFAEEPIVDPNEEWKAEQQEAATIGCFFNEASPLWVSATGDEKHMLFVDAAKHSPNSVTVVLVPTIKLVDGIMRRAKEAGVLTSSELRCDSKGLVVMTYSKVQTEETWELLLQLIAVKRVLRIFIDEVQCLLSDSSRDLHHCLQVLSGLVPVTLLTETAPQEIANALQTVHAIEPALKIPSDHAV